MDKRKFIKTGAAGMLAVATGSIISCKGKVEIASVPSILKGMQALRGNVGFYEGKGGTIGWYVKDNVVAVIDAQFPDTVKPLIKNLQAKSDEKIELLINTHHHGDHTAGNVAFEDIVTTHVAHINAVKNQKINAEKKKNERQQLYATTLFDETWSHDLGGEKIKCYYWGAAHTDGDIITHFENANVVHMGDLVFNRRFPYIDKGAGANIKNWIAVLDQTINTFDIETQFIFGHSDNGFPVAGNQEDIRAMTNYLEKLLEHLTKQQSEGALMKDLLEMCKSIPGAEEWKGKGINRSIEAAWQELFEE